MTRAALYLRISQDRTGEHLGVERQEEDCRELAKGLDWDVAEAYVDNDVSATSGRTRPRYQKMLEDIALGQIDAIICWSPDRLYRRARDLEDLIPILEAHSVQVRTVKAGDLDLTSAYGRMIARILGAIATGEGEVKSERWSRSWRQGREAGRVARTGTRLFGYDPEMNPIDDEAAVAREMAQRIAEGQPILTVCRWLDDQGITGTRGQAWTPASLKYFLTNPRIAGWSTHDGAIVAKGQWQPIIDPEQWEAVRALLTARTRPYVPRKALLGGLIFCGKCGFRMVTSSQRQTRTYRCPNRPSLKGCGAVSGNSAPIEEIVESFAKARLADPRVRKRIAELRAEPTGTQAEVATLQLRIAELKQTLDDPAVPVAAILAAIERAETKQGELLNQLAARNLTPIPEAGDTWPDELRVRRALVDLVVERVDLMPSNRRHASRLGFDHERVVVTGRDITEAE